MLTTVEAILQANGALQFLEPVHLTGSQRVLVTFTEPAGEALGGAALSEPSLAADWLRDEEDAAWAHLQRPLGQQADGNTGGPEGSTGPRA